MLLRCSTYLHYRGEKVFQLSADIKWKDSKSLQKMENYLHSFKCNKKSNLKRVFKDSSPPLEQIKLSIKCGKKKNRSSFIFLKNTKITTKIVGSCRTNLLIHLIDDFDYLKEQMSKSDLAFELSDAKIKLDNNKLIENKNKGFLSKKSILVDLFGTIGFIPAASIYLLFGEFTLVTLIPFILGLIFWVGSVVIGCWTHPKYVLIENEN